MLKAAIFDLDGTITDTLPVSAAAFIKTLHQHTGREYTPSEIFAMFGPPEEIIFEHLKPSQGQLLMSDYLANYRQVHPQYASIYPQVTEALTWLKEQGIPCSIVTGKGRDAARITLELMGLEEIFPLVVTGSCVDCPKPEPEGILAVLRTLGVPAQKAFYLGDSPGDIQAARGARVLSLGALWGSRHPEALLKAQPDLAFATPGQFLAWLKGEY
jgi:HAD superfamily hydrolase (TIGR01549 family)